MFKFTRRTEYALIAMRHLQSKSISEITTTKEISDQYVIPFEILSKVLQSLAKVKIIKPVYGPNGGYIIKQNLSNISLWDFLEIMEGPLGLADCFIDSDCTQLDNCNIRTPIQQINTKMKTILSEMTVSDVTL